MSAPADTVNKLIAMENAHDIEGYMALIAADIILRGPGGFSVKGEANVRDHIKETMSAFPDEHTEVKHQWVDGDTVISEIVITLTHNGDITLADGTKVPPTGKRLTTEQVSIERVSDGKVVESTQYFDRNSFLEQLGQLPVPAR